jgi:hypothetical protein
MQRGERVWSARSDMPPSHLDQAGEFLARNGQLVCKGSGQGSQWTIDASREARREESMVLLIPIQESSTPSLTEQEDPLILPRTAVPIPSQTRPDQIPRSLEISSFVYHRSRKEAHFECYFPSIKHYHYHCVTKFSGISPSSLSIWFGLPLNRVLLIVSPGFL